MIPEQRRSDIPCFIIFKTLYIFNRPTGLKPGFLFIPGPATIDDDRRNSLSIKDKIAKCMRFALPRGNFSELITLGPQFYAFLHEGTPIYL